jgi:hypothetical protein
VFTLSQQQEVPCGCLRRNLPCLIVSPVIRFFFSTLFTTRTAHPVENLYRTLFQQFFHTPFLQFFHTLTDSVRTSVLKTKGKTNRPGLELRRVEQDDHEHSCRKIKVEAMFCTWCELSHKHKTERRSPNVWVSSHPIQSPVTNPASITKMRILHCC